MDGWMDGETPIKMKIMKDQNREKKSRWMVDSTNQSMNGRHENGGTVHLTHLISVLSSDINP